LLALLALLVHKELLVLKAPLVKEPVEILVR
jgi:hypothetical protein